MPEESLREEDKLTQSIVEKNRVIELKNIGTSPTP